MFRRSSHYWKWKNDQYWLDYLCFFQDLLKSSKKFQEGSNVGVFDCSSATVHGVSVLNLLIVACECPSIFGYFLGGISNTMPELRYWVFLSK